MSTLIMQLMVTSLWIKGMRGNNWDWLDALIFLTILFDLGSSLYVSYLNRKLKKVTQQLEDLKNQLTKDDFK